MITLKLEVQLINVIRLKHYSPSTEETYVGWYRRYVRWHEMKHPKEMGAAEVEAFLTHLAANLKLSLLALSPTASRQSAANRVALSCPGP